MKRIYQLYPFLAPASFISILCYEGLLHEDYQIIDLIVGVTDVHPWPYSLCFGMNRQ